MAAFWTNTTQGLGECTSERGRNEGTGRHMTTDTAADVRLEILVAMLSAPATNPLALELLKGTGAFEDKLTDAVTRLAGRVAG